MVGMKKSLAAVALPAAVAVALSAPGAATAAPFIECQHPVTTGVEISHLKNVTKATACPVALALYRYENSGHVTKIYGCKRPNGPNAPGRPYLKTHTFQGWHMSLGGRYGYNFTFSRGTSSFAVSGTDFPVNCT